MYTKVLLAEVEFMTFEDIERGCGMYKDAADLLIGAFRVRGGITEAQRKKLPAWVRRRLV